MTAVGKQRTRALQRVIVYVDGFNLYYGLKSKGWKRYYWLDLRKLAQRLLRTGYTLEIVRYFTARVLREPTDPDKPRRQDTYLQALMTLPNLSIQYGYFLPKEQHCAICGATWKTYEEKMSDVNIALKLIEDGQDDAFDTAILVSADGDLAGPVADVGRRYPGKQVVIAFPPGRASKKLREVASAYFTIGRALFRDSQLPDRLIKADGHVLERPTNWR